MQERVSNFISAAKEAKEEQDVLELVKKEIATFRETSFRQAFLDDEISHFFNNVLSTAIKQAENPLIARLLNVLHAHYEDTLSAILTHDFNRHKPVVLLHELATFGDSEIFRSALDYIYEFGRKRFTDDEEIINYLQNVGRFPGGKGSIAACAARRSHITILVELADRGIDINQPVYGNESGPPLTMLHSDEMDIATAAFLIQQARGTTLLHDSRPLYSLIKKDVGDMKYKNHGRYKITDKKTNKPYFPVFYAKKEIDKMIYLCQQGAKLPQESAWENQVLDECDKNLRLQGEFITQLSGPCPMLQIYSGQEQWKNLDISDVKYQDIVYLRGLLAEKRGLNYTASDYESQLKKATLLRSARIFFVEAAVLGHRSACITLGDDCYQKRKYSEAIDWYKAGRLSLDDLKINLLDNPEHYLELAHFFHRCKGGVRKCSPTISIEFARRAYEMTKDDKTPAIKKIALGALQDINHFFTFHLKEMLELEALTSADAKIVEDIFHGKEDELLNGALFIELVCSNIKNKAQADRWCALSILLPNLSELAISLLRGPTGAENVRQFLEYLLDYLERHPDAKQWIDEAKLALIKAVVWPEALPEVVEEKKSETILPLDFDLTVPPKTSGLLPIASSTQFFAPAPVIDETKKDVAPKNPLKKMKELIQACQLDEGYMACIRETKGEACLADAEQQCNLAALKKFIPFMRRMPYTRYFQGLDPQKRSHVSQLNQAIYAELTQLAPQEKNLRLPSLKVA